MTPGTISKTDLSGKSALAQELAGIPPTLRQRFGLPDELIFLLDAIIAALRALDNVSDHRPWPQRLEEALDGLWLNIDDQHHAERLIDGIKTAADEKTLANLNRRSNTDSFGRFVHKILGEASYQRLVGAMRSDGEIAVRAIRKGVQKAMPLTLAFDDSVAFLTPSQLARVEGMDKLAKSSLTLAIELDSILDQLIGSNFNLPDIRVSERALNTSEDLEAVARSVQEVLAGQSREELEELSSKLSRKIQGAHDAIDRSADGNSQAASSLVEFIDRLFRSAFDDAETLTFLDQRFPNETDTTYIRDEVRRPTKKGQALCFMYAGNSQSDPIPLIELPAHGLVSARSTLQRIKHADEGTVDEADQVKDAIRAVEGFFVIAVRVGWTMIGTEDVMRLRTRLGE